MQTDQLRTKRGGRIPPVTPATQYFTLDDLTVRTRLSVATIRRATAKLRLRTVTAGRRRLWPLSEVEKLDQAMLGGRLRDLPASPKLSKPDAAHSAA
ncbi:hypothetical protein [uncultured Bosea sp.]|uniref:hypothetical protein n=1 Tax=uncultured Bosea sp. TaxID=211457 RepID=UPI0025F66AC9|nr:hypothetical protein [uncultured Bosea sp.]